MRFIKCILPLGMCLVLIGCTCQEQKIEGEGKVAQYEELSIEEQQQVDDFVSFLPDDVLQLLIESDIFGISTGNANGIRIFTLFDDGREDMFARPSTWYHITKQYSLCIAFRPILFNDKGELLVNYDSIGVTDELTKNGLFIEAKLYGAAWEKMLVSHGDG